MRRAAAAFLLLLSACARKGTAVYQEPGGSFSCAAPADWRVVEDGGTATFLGPASGARPYAASISVYVTPNSGVSPRPITILDGRDEDDGAQDESGMDKPREFTSVRSARPSTVPRPSRDRAYGAPVGSKRLYALVHSAPQSEPSLGAGDFDVVLQSFRRARRAR